MDIFNAFNPERFLTSLQYMWQGMLCIFAVIGIIILVVYAMNKITPDKADKKAPDDNEENRH